jgi:hypothetical protein
MGLFEQVQELFIEGQIVGVARFADESDSATGALGIEVEGNAEIRGSGEFCQERFLSGRICNELVVGFDVVDGAESDGNGRDGGKGRFSFRFCGTVFR